MGLYEKFMRSVPKRIPVDPGDYVHWTAFDESKKEAGRWNYTACYSPIMEHLGNYEIHCVPYHRGQKKLRHGNRMHPLTYLQFMRECQDHGLIPPEVRFFADRGAGNCMLIPRLGWDRHTVYTVLSLYRHADCQPRNMIAALRLRQSTRLPWLQVLHFVLSKMGHASGHAFINMQPGAYGNYGGLNPGSGMALCAFASLSPGEEREYLGNLYNTSAAFSEMANTVNPLLSTARSKSWRNPESAPTYLYSSQQDILEPKFSPLYTDSNLGAEDLQRIMKEA